MAAADRNAPVPTKKRRRASRPHGLPSPALCCACGLCIMLAGLNITLVGAFAFSTLLPSANPPIIIGPVLLLVAFSFFGACCVCSRLPPPPRSSRSKVGGRGGGSGGGGGGGGGGLAGRGGLGGGAAFEIETSEHTLQDTTAVQLSPTSSPGSSRASSPEEEEEEDAVNGVAADNADVANDDADTALPGACKLFTMETNAASSAVYTVSSAAGREVRLNLPREEVVA